MPHPFRLQKAVNVCKDLNLYKEDSPYASSVHADGKGDRLALSMQQAVALYDANTLQCIQILLEGKTASDASISSFRGNPKLATAKCGGALTEIGFDNHLLIGSLNNSDGSVIVWDSRTQNGGVMICQSGAPALSFSLNCSGTLLCSGTEKVGEDASICFWDMRNPAAKLGEFKEVHSDDVTQTRFHPRNPNWLASGSTDGLLSLFDLSNGVLDEDAAIQYTNPGDSVSKIGFFGPNEEFLYSITHMETFCLYTAADLSVISSYGDVRNEQTGIDYVVDCAYVPESQRLFLLSGTRDGAVNISNVNIDSIELIYAMSGGHSDIVRGMKYQSGTLYSVAEDGQLCLWNQ